MSEVRRYLFDARAGTLSRYEDGAKMILSADGELIMASDYDALAAALSGSQDELFKAMAHVAELEAALREGCALLEENHTSMQLCPDEDHEYINRVNALLDRKRWSIIDGGRALYSQE